MITVMRWTYKQHLVLIFLFLFLFFSRTEASASLVTDNGQIKKKKTALEQKVPFEKHCVTNDQCNAFRKGSKH